jgi:hypothetical protein
MNPATPNNEQLNQPQQQPTDNGDVTMKENEQTVSTPIEKIDKEKDMAELLITMDNYTPIVSYFIVNFQMKIIITILCI